MADTATPTANNLTALENAEIRARYNLHKAKKVKQGGTPLSFEAWLTFYQAGTDVRAREGKGRKKRAGSK